MNKEAYITPSIETILLELDQTILVGSRTTMEIDPIPNNGGIDFIEGE